MYEMLHSTRFSLFSYHSFQFFNKNVADREDTLKREDHEAGRFVNEFGDDSQLTYSDGMFEGDISNPGLNADTVEMFMSPGMYNVSYNTADIFHVSASLLAKYCAQYE